jgi:Trypsin-co-occurring domain 1
MPELVEYRLEDGGSVLVSVGGSGENDVITRGWGEDRPRRVAEQANETFEAVVAKVRPAADAVLASLSGLRSAPDEITVEFAIQLTADAGICIASLGSSANFKVALSWTSRGKAGSQLA